MGKRDREGRKRDREGRKRDREERKRKRRNKERGKVEHEKVDQERKRLLVVHVQPCSLLAEENCTALAVFGPDLVPAILSRMTPAHRNAPQSSQSGSIQRNKDTV